MNMSSLVHNTVIQRFFLGLLVFLSLHFAYHLVWGQRGLVEVYNLNVSIKELRHDMHVHDKAYAKLSDHVVRLRPGSIDPDFLDEQVLRVLGRPYASVIPPNISSEL